MPALRRTVALAAATLSLMGAGAFEAQAAPAEQTRCEAGMVPLTNQNTWVRAGSAYGGTVLYTLPAGSGFRIIGGPVFSESILWMYGNGNGMSAGWVPAQNLTCN